MQGNQGTKYLLRYALDGIVLVISFLLTRKFISEKGDIFFSNFNLLLLFISFSIWVFAGKIFHLYDDLLYNSFAYELIPIIKTLIIHYIFIAFIFFYFFPQYFFPRTFTLLYNGLIFILMPLQKYIYKHSKIKVTSKRNSKNVLLIGAGKLGNSFYEKIISDRNNGLSLVGFLDDNLQSEVNGLHLGKISDLQQTLDTREVDDVIVALPHAAVEKIEQIILISEKNAKRIKIIPDYYRFSSGNFTVETFGTFPLISVRPSPLDQSEHRAIKRVFDIVFSIIFIIFIFSWLLPIIALLIKATSNGPVFFIQERWGLKNRKIACYKFRSMVSGSKDVDHTGKYQQAHKNDSRITKIGKFLRKANLDELPQFINVLWGDMSIVGPRPHPIPLNLESKDTVENYMLRHLVKPGITGWAQVNGHRGETKKPGQMQQRVNFDLWYIENWSFWLDVQIVAQTVINMVKGDKNAV